MFNPLAVAMAFGNGAQQNHAGIADLLDAFDGDVDCKLVVSLLFAFIFATLGMVSIIMVRDRPLGSPRVLLTRLTLVACAVQILLLPAASRWWYWGGVFSWALTTAAIAYLVEPRPSHWLPSLERIRATLGTPSAWHQSLRRWWRWRKKYERKTKLNV